NRTPTGPPRLSSISIKRRRPRRQPERPEANRTLGRRPLPVKTFALLVASLVALASANLHAAEIIPPKPARYFNDYAGVVPKDAALRFNEQLAQFERETSNQVLVA